MKIDLERESIYQLLLLNYSIREFCTKMSVVLECFLIGNYSNNKTSWSRMHNKLDNRNVLLQNAVMSLIAILVGINNSMVKSQMEKRKMIIVTTNASQASKVGLVTSCIQRDKSLLPLYYFLICKITAYYYKWTLLSVNTAMFVEHCTHDTMTPVQFKIFCTISMYVATHYLHNICSVFLLCMLFAWSAFVGVTFHTTV